MGDYSVPQNFYLIDGSELVNVEQDLNYNLQRADDRVRPLVEYKLTDEPSISSSSLPKDTGFKWYKWYTGAIWNYRAGGVFQDGNSQVDTWSVSGLTFEAGYGSLDLEASRIAYSVGPGNFVRFRGRLVLNSGTSDLPLNTTVNCITLPTSILPVRQKYFTCYGGNSTGTEFQVFRVFIPQQGSGDDRMEFIKYGGAGASAGERYLSLNDIFYAIDDTP